MRAFIFLLIGALTQCSSSQSPSDGVAASCKTSVSAAQVEGAQCCPDYGLDACGAGLFCAAYDGRTVSSCYKERSRANLASCSADRECASGDCAETAGKCRGLLGEKCEVAVGCANPN